jgi:hypothetical protein
MKKSTIILAMIMTNLFVVRERLHSQVNVSVKSGINIATTKDLMESSTSRTGFYAGAQAVIPLFKKLFFQTELLFSTKGSKYRVYTTEKASALRMNYLNLPLLAGYNITDKTRLLLGAELGYLLEAQLRTPYNKMTVTESFPRKFDVGIAIGATQKFGKRLGFEARYIYGLPDFYQVDNAGARVNNKDASHRVFQGGLFYRFI